MREPVCIVLNEREPLKKKACDSLFEALKRNNITASRLDITPDISEIILARKPRILVLDYLLGDYSTGLDILAAVNTLEVSKRPKTFFLTDEPSVPVAVDALKMGALNYLEIENSESINRLTLDIKALLLENQSLSKKSLIKRAITIDDLVADSKAGQRIITEAKTIVTKRSPLVILYGPKGAGHSTLAEALHTALSPNATSREINLRYYDKPINQLTGWPKCSDTDLRIGNNLALTINQIEDDDGSLLDNISSYYKQIWSEKGEKHGTSLILCTNDPKEIQSWRRLTTLEAINLPSINQRTEDIAPLVQSFLNQCEEMVGKRAKGFDAALMNWITTLDWPGNISQLKACIIDSAIAHIQSSVDIRENIELHRTIWSEERAVYEETSIDQLSAAITLEISRNNYRIAAARLGCSVKDLKLSLLGGAN